MNILEQNINEPEDGRDSMFEESHLVGTPPDAINLSLAYVFNSEMVVCCSMRFLVAACNCNTGSPAIYPAHPKKHAAARDPNRCGRFG